MKEEPEILQIRKLLRVSRAQFGRFINRSEPSIRRYEAGCFVPLEVMINARKWRKLYNEIYGRNEEEKE